MTWKIMKSKAVFDKSNLTFPYRYSLIKMWDPNLPKATIIMLNPSIADEIKNDNSVNRCLNFLIDHGYGMLEVVNLFAYIETDSKKLKASSLYVGPENDEYILKAIEKTSCVIIGWGSDNNYKNRKKQVLSLIADMPLYYFEDFSGRTPPTHVSKLKRGFELSSYGANL